MPERSFAKEVESLRLRDGEVFHGEGILAATKALLQSGVSYVGGYQGAPISHLMDVFADAKPLLDELGIHFETCANEAGAAAMLAASINYPLRGAVTWKATVGTNVASDALSNLASAGVKGGALILIGEDYGEGSSIIQERSHAFAMKSQIWLMDPRPNPASIVDAVEQAFQLSEVSNTPVMLEMRIRACHVHGTFVAKDNKTPQFSRNHVIENPDFDYGRICLPPSTYAQEKHKIDQRWPAAVKFIRDNKLNDILPGRDGSDIGIILQGGMYNAVIRALQLHGLADAYGDTDIPLYVLNVTYPLVPEEVTAFCAGKRAVLMVEEGQPDYLEQAINSILRRADVQTRLVGKDVLPLAGEYTGEVMLSGVAKFLEGAVPAGVDIGAAGNTVATMLAPKAKAAELLGAALPGRAPGFCVGCPERPVFSAMKLVEKEVGKLNVSADIGCHTFATLPPFNMGNTVLGYGLGLASSSGVAPNLSRRVVSVMGDGGFWHNGLASGIANAMFNKDDSVLVIMENGYTSATGAQHIPSTGKDTFDRPTDMSIENALRGVGVKWIRRVRTYSVSRMVDTFRAALTTKTKGLKVIIADSECQLARQRRIKPLIRQQLKDGRRVVRTKFGVDEDVCTGDHACIRLSACPSLTIKPNPDPLKDQPVATVDNNCVGCGLCGENAHAAVLCPSFYQADVVQNPNAWDRLLNRVRAAVIGALQGREAAA